ncbi:CTP synthase C-terminal region-related (seleno)protein [Paenibacillus methanolicus]|uniref:CTP synthase (glutamine hydrolyzing) n=1 Tax=Paenibacillus methanolicus TaxID=582686 RepID=A0A5S5BZA4_9BACL|nr:gamma-glutamyl-gamma-aminobutyrate hydrolase family protein [Paenibacillus methanolicus]TYP72387.1 glutamine amidotransferase class I [Paenibacillus methanolicus]
MRIGLIGDYNEEVVAHRAIPEAIRLAAEAIGAEAESEWISTPRLDEAAEDKLARYDGLWCVPASPYRSMNGALNGIRYARERGVPFLGTCGGFQHMIIEFARNVAGLADADHAEINPEASVVLVAPLTCFVSEQTNAFRLTPGSRTAAIYGAQETVEQYGTCNYGPDPAYNERLEAAGLRIAGVDTDGTTRIMELPSHPFMIGMLFQPERSALKGASHPLIRGFVQAARDRRKM